MSVRELNESGNRRSGIVYVRLVCSVCIDSLLFLVVLPHIANDFGPIQGKEKRERERRKK